MDAIEQTSIAARIEHTMLRPTMTYEDVERLCAEAMEHEFAGVCVPPSAVLRAKEALSGSDVALVTVVGFPLGYQTTADKAQETRKALEDGADEIDMVINIMAFKSGDDKYVLNEISTLAALAHMRDSVLKVIIETAYLNDEELERICSLCVEAEADYVKTSTGFAPDGARVEVIRKLRSLLPDSMKIKASGGIRTKEQAQAMIEAGADRLGASSGIALIS